MIRDLLVLIFIGVNAWFDYRKQEISLISLFIFGIVGIFLYKNGGLLLDNKQFLSLLPGTGLLITAMVSNGKVGIGDGLIVFMLGIYLSLEEILWVLFSSLTGATFYSWILYKKKGDNANFLIPFVPFLLGGFVGGLYLWIT